MSNKIQALIKVVYYYDNLALLKLFHTVLAGRRSQRQLSEEVAQTHAQSTTSVEKADQSKFLAVFLCRPRQSVDKHSSTSGQPRSVA